MGNLSSKSNLVVPLSKQKDVTRRRSLRERLLCIDNRIAPMAASLSRQCSTRAVNSADIEDSCTSSSSEYSVHRLEGHHVLPGDRTPLPDIGEGEKLHVHRKKTRRNQVGRVSSVAYNVDFMQRPTSSYMVRTTRPIPTRLNRLPAITRDVMEAR